jgi:CheY-like chemotaxis protein
MPHTILIVDDNDSFRGMLSTVMSERGYAVVAARSGAEALTLAAEYHIDAALVDVDMPGMDGFEFCRQFSAQEGADGPKVPVWIMTGVLQLGLNRKAAAVGALLVLRKPLDVDAICAQIEQELQQRKATGGSPDATPPPPAS